MASTSRDLVAVAGSTATVVTSTGAVMKFRYDRHDVTAAFAGGCANLPLLEVNQAFHFPKYWKGDTLTVRVMKHTMNPDGSQDMDFGLNLGGAKGKGKPQTMVFAHLGRSYFTIKGHAFCQRSSSHIVFEKVVRPLLEGAARRPVKKEQDKHFNHHLAIIDLTEEDAKVEEFREDVKNVLKNIIPKREYFEKSETMKSEHRSLGKRSRGSSSDAQPSKQARLGLEAAGLASRIQEIFPDSHKQAIEERVQQLLGDAASCHLAEDAFDRITEELLQEQAVVEGGVKVEIKDEDKSELTVEQKERMLGNKKEVLARRGIKEEEGWPVEEVKTEDGVLVNDETINGKQEAAASRRKEAVARREAPMELSLGLAGLLGTGATRLSRAQVMKLLWAYLREEGLQDPADRQFFTPNPAMQAIFGSARMRGASMSKFITDHLSKPKWEFL